jgi:hypothetical protein
MSGEGGLSWLNRDILGDYCEPYSLSFESAVLILFGPAWTAVVPWTAPRISDEDLALAGACPDMYRAKMAEQWFPWGTAVAIYDSTRDDAATTIQRHFRGWWVRMRTAFNPNTRIGAYYALKEFRTFILRMAASPPPEK